MNDAVRRARIGDTPTTSQIVQGLKRAALVDDAYDPLDQIEFQSSERDDLWGRLVADNDALDELTQTGHDISGPDELTGEVLIAFDRSRSKCPAFANVWKASLVGNRVEGTKAIVNQIAEHLTRDFKINVKKFGGSASIDSLVKQEFQLIFLDWYLGDDMSTAVDAAIAKAKEILLSWPTEWPKPIIVLMSSKPGISEYVDKFCRRSGILRGMFYAVAKSELRDPFKLHMHMQLFEMSLPAGRRLQAFIDALNKELALAACKFVAGIRELSLNDYAYIQSLSLQGDGQPLGDYLVWLFSTYFGQILFAEALQEQLADLDTMTFTKALPNSGPPSGRLADLYHCALFDTSVGPAGEHPRAAKERCPIEPIEHLTLSLGDVFENSKLNHKNEDDTIIGDATVDTVSVIESESEAVDTRDPDLFLVINSQCDLAFTPDQNKRPMDPDRSILLVPGYRQLILEPVTDRGLPRTELYMHDERSYRVIWNPKRVLAIPYGQFDAWQREQGRKRVARLRLPYALEVQRVFATDLIRVGMPVMPPICQRVAAKVLRVCEQDKTFQETDGLQDEEAVLLVLTRDVQKIRQQCVLTPQLISRLKASLDERLAAMQAELDATNGDPYLPRKIKALERVLADPNNWAPLRFPFDLPTPKGAKRFLNDRIQIVQGKKEGDTSDGQVIVAVSLDLS